MAISAKYGDKLRLPVPRTPTLVHAIDLESRGVRLTAEEICLWPKLWDVNARLEACAEGEFVEKGAFRVAGPAKRRVHDTAPYREFLRLASTSGVDAATGSPVEFVLRGQNFGPPSAAAAVREAAEEASVSLAPASLVWFAYWVPPPVMPIRFATFFFAAIIIFFLAATSCSFF